jgi:hypothetical protein
VKVLHLEARSGLKQRIRSKRLRCQALINNVDFD